MTAEPDSPDGEDEGLDHDVPAELVELHQLRELAGDRSADARKAHDRLAVSDAALLGHGEDGEEQ